MSDIGGIRSYAFSFDLVRLEYFENVIYGIESELFI